MSKGREPADGAVAVPLVYVGVEETPIEFMNQFVLQIQDDDVILTLGAVSPPLILADTPEERRRQAEAVRFVPVRVLGRYGMTKQRLRELVDVLSKFVDQPGGSSK